MREEGVTRNAFGEEGGTVHDSSLPSECFLASTRAWGSSPTLWLARCACLTGPGTNFVPLRDGDLGADDGVPAPPTAIPSRAVCPVWSKKFRLGETPPATTRAMDFSKAFPPGSGLLLKTFPPAGARR